MYGEIIEKKRNTTPLIYTSETILHYQERDRFIDELAHLYNKYGIDSRIGMHDFILAETTWNFIATMHNAKVAELKLIEK